MQHPISLPAPDERELAQGERVTVRVSSRRPVRARLVEEPPPGFAVERADLREALAREGAGCRVAASRHGAELTATRLPDLAGHVQRSGLTLALGAPKRGLPVILGVDVEAVDDSAAAFERAIDAREGTAADRSGDGPTDSTSRNDDAAVGPAPGGFDLWLNTIPKQGSETVRTEEALFASLATCTLTE